MHVRRLVKRILCDMRRTLTDLILFIGSPLLFTVGLIKKKTKHKNTITLSLRTNLFLLISLAINIHKLHNGKNKVLNQRQLQFQ